MVSDTLLALGGDHLARLFTMPGAAFTIFVSRGALRPQPARRRQALSTFECDKLPRSGMAGLSPGGNPGGQGSWPIQTN